MVCNPATCSPTGAAGLIDSVPRPMTFRESITPPGSRPNALTWRRSGWLGCVVWLALVVVAPSVLSAQSEESPSEETATSRPIATGVAELMLEGRSVTAVPASQYPDGPRFALQPIAEALGVELRIGPLGDSHTLVYEDRQIILGPAQALMITVAPDGRTQKEISRLRHIPVRDASGLKVSLDLLSRAIGEPLNYQFDWRPEALDLVVSRPELRRLTGEISLVHQHQVSSIVIELSESPRYRVERSPEALEIRLIGDRLEEPFIVPEASDPLVPAIVVAADRLRFDLAADAVADEPRLLSSPRPRLVIEVSRRAVPKEIPASSPRRQPTRRPGIRTIVLDPGHGGVETGAIGPGGSAEAQLNLQVARALRGQLERRLPVKVVMTRSDDVDIPLETRAAIANEHRADLFISLHFNSSFGSRAHGAETYFLSREASDQIAAEVAAAENRLTSPAAAPELDLQMILWDLAQSYHLAESQRFANLVQEELNLTLGLRDRGVKQAPFHVLMGAKMPAVLVELGFLSNPEEEAKLESPIYRAELVDALVRAVIRFKKQVEGQSVAQQGSEAGGGNGARGRDPS